MTYEMRMKDLRNEAFAEGEANGLAKGETKGKFEYIKNLMSSMNISIDKAMDILKTPPEERQQYKDFLAKGV